MKVLSMIVVRVALAFVGNWAFALGGGEPLAAGTFDLKKTQFLAIPQTEVAKNIGKMEERWLCEAFDYKNVSGQPVESLVTNPATVLVKDSVVSFKFHEGKNTLFFEETDKGYFDTMIVSKTNARNGMKVVEGTIELKVIPRQRQLWVFFNIQSATMPEARYGTIYQCRENPEF